jgi:hypothetical protein
MSKTLRKRATGKAGTDSPVHEQRVLEDVHGEILPTKEIAKELGVSVATIDRARMDGRLKAVPYGKGFGYRRTETLEVGDIRKKTPAATRAEFEGKRDAQIIALLEENATISEIVTTTQVALITVLDIRRGWMTARTLERRESSYPCRCGAPSDPRATLCMTCFAGLRSLNSAQIALVEGHPVEVGTCVCSSCGTQNSIDTSLHLCGKCGPRVSLKLAGEGLVLVAGDHVVRAWSPEETKHLLQPLIAKAVATQTAFLTESMRVTEEASSLVPREVPQGSDLQDLLTSLSLKLET